MRRILISIVLAYVASSADAQRVCGHYILSGSNADGSTYQGDVQIVRTGTGTCSIAWKTQQASLHGICLKNGNGFIASYENGGKLGVASYVVNADGTLTGSWTEDGMSSAGAETLTPG